MAKPQQTAPPPNKPRGQAIAALLSKGLSKALRLVRTVGNFPAWAMKTRLRSIVVGGVLSTLVSVFSVTLMLSPAPQIAKPIPPKLSEALDLLDRHQFGTAREMAMQILGSGSIPKEELGGPTFVLGAATAYEADEMLESHDKGRFYLIATRYLEDSHQLGFPHDREPEGNFLLGKSLFKLGLFARAIPPLQAALEKGYRENSQLHRMLATAFLKDSHPRAEQALPHLDQYLADKKLETKDRQLAQLDRAEAMFLLGKKHECRAMLEQIPAGSAVRPEALLLLGKLMIEEANSLRVKAGETPPAHDGPAAKKYDEAISILRQAQGRDVLSNDTARKAAYAIGLALWHKGDLRAAANQLTRMRRGNIESPEGLVIGLTEAEIYRELNQDEEAMPAYRRVSRALIDDDMEHFHNPWIVLEDLKKRIEQGIAHYRQAAKFDRAIEIAEMFTKVLGEARSVQLQAESQADWFALYAKQADDQPEGKSAGIRVKARQQARKAGHTYAALSKLHAAQQEYPEDLWKSASLLLLGRDYVAAVGMFRAYLTNGSKDHRAEALLGLAEALLAQGKYDEAIAIVRECLEFYPKHPVIYKVRLVGANVLIQRGAETEARQMLMENLNNDSLTPRSLEWRDSLFQLGMLQYEEGISLELKSRQARGDAREPEKAKQSLKLMEQAHAALQEAIQKLAEAVERYPDAAQSIPSHYMLAQAHRFSARLPQMKSETVTIESARLALTKQLRGSLDASIEQYADLQRILNEKQEKTELNAEEKKMLRNCYFAQGSVLFELGRYEEAIRAYSTATNRYQHEPESLEAFVQIAACYRRLNRNVEARGTLEQAKFVLRKMRSDADFAATTRSSREEWVTLLDWLSTL